MALGTLSPDQDRYASSVATATGLDPSVVRAWIGAESGWGTQKPGHNYLNVGPGETYQSVDQAAARVVGLLTSSHYYQGIRDAIPAGAAAQVKAIEQSPWDAGHYGGNGLETIYGQLGATSAGTTTAAGTGAAALGQIFGKPSTGDVGAAGTTEAGFKVPGWVPFIGGWDPIGGAAQAAGSVVTQATEGAFVMFLTLMLTGAGLGLIALGLSRLSNKPLKEHIDNVQKTAGTVAQVAALA